MYSDDHNHPPFQQPPLLLGPFGERYCHVVLVAVSHIAVIKRADSKTGWVAFASFFCTQSYLICNYCRTCHPVVSVRRSPAMHRTESGRLGSMGTSQGLTQEHDCLNMLECQPQFGKPTNHRNWTGLDPSNVSQMPLKFGVHYSETHQQPLGLWRPIQQRAKSKIFGRYPTVTCWRGRCGRVLIDYLSKQCSRY